MTADFDPSLVELMARTEVALVGDDWDEPALHPMTPRERAEEFREDFRNHARATLAALREAGWEVRPADYDRDPAALAWAREGVQFHIDRARRFEQHARGRGDTEKASLWRRIANFVDMSLIGNRNCVIATFDERRPQMKTALDSAKEVER